MKKIVMFILALCLCFTAVGAAFAETAATEAPAAEYYRRALAAGYTPDEKDQEVLEAVLGDDYQQK